MLYLVGSEDTRKTGFLLQHFEIKKAQLSFREDNEERILPRLMEFLKQGKNAALVTDAGTPGISDPGFTLVRAALAEGIAIEAIPGATACILALILSGLPVHSFTFRGFPPHKGGPRKRFLEIDRESPHSLIFYESPYRLGAFLTDALEIYGDRRVAIANDLTKKFELVERGTISEFAEKYQTAVPRGEYTVVIEGKI
jgi:16S rRNA (cytidine1402-2'-O)-methyltransferase